MNRLDVKKERIWDLSHIFASQEAFEEEFLSLSCSVRSVVKYHGKLKDKKELRKCLNEFFSIVARVEKLYVYTMLNNDQNVADNNSVALKSRAEGLFVNFSSASSFITPELSEFSDAELDALIADKDFKDVDYMLLGIKKSKQHILSEKEEKLLAMGSEVFSSAHNIFNVINNVEMPFGEIEMDGVKTRLTHGKYSQALQNKDIKVRKAGFDCMYKAVKDIINTLSTTYISSVKKDNYLAVIRNYSSAKASSMENDDVPSGVYDALIKNVEKALPDVHEYVKLRKKAIGGELHMYDMYVPIVEDAEMSVDYDEAKKIVLEGLKPMGAEYGKLLETAFESRWIDVEETENKRSGAYSCGVFGVHPFVLLNYSNTTHDIFTIAHELGHALHSYYSSKEQCFAKHDYSIFVAEVASTVNEVLLIKHLIKTVKDDNVRKYLLSYYLDTIRTTLFRQTMFSEFEGKTHEAEQEGNPLTENYLSEMYLELNKKYYGDGVIHDDGIRYEWARIPHFYRAFYVYKYATGIISAINIANMIEKGDTDKYFEFLKAGGKKSPYEILKDAGVDLMTDAPYDVAFGEFKFILEELKKYF